MSLPPFLFCSTADDEAFATDIVAQGNEELARYVDDAPERLLGLVRCRWVDRAPRRKPAGHWTIWGWTASRSAATVSTTDDLWALLSEHGTFVFLHPSGGRIRSGSWTSGSHSWSATR